MAIDFSKLNGIAYTPRNAPDSPSEQPDGADIVKPYEGTQNPAQGTTENDSAIKTLQRRADLNGADKERALKVYKTYQHNLITVSQLQAEILKGAAAGGDLCDLFLKAAHAIALLTNDNVFYGEIERDVRAVHGIGLSEAAPLRAELEEIEGRLLKLRAAAETATGDDLKRIQHAIAEHERQAEVIRVRSSG